MTKRFSYIKNNSITQYQSLPIQEIGKSKSLHCQWVVDKLNKLSDENEQLKETIKELELENAKHIGDGEWDIRDITYGHGKFRLEEWGERYHQFYDGDKPLEDEEVVSLLFENEQLKQQLLYDGEDVCSICKHMYLISKGDYFIGKCKKGHEECSKEDIKYCEDFELKGDVE